MSGSRRSTGTDATVVAKPVRSLLGPAIAVAVVVLGGAAAFVFVPRTPPAPVAEDAPVAVDAGSDLRPDAGATIQIVALEVPAVIDAGEALPAAHPVDAGLAVKPHPAGPTKEALSLRLARLTSQLAQRDKKLGERDRVLHQLLDAAEKSLSTAKTLEERKGVAERFDDLQAQLRQ